MEVNDDQPTVTEEVQNSTTAMEVNSPAEEDEPGQIHDTEQEGGPENEEPLSAPEFPLRQQADGDVVANGEGEPPSKKSKTDDTVVIQTSPEDDQDDEDEFPAEWRALAGQEDEDEDDGFEVTVDEARPRIDYRKNQLSKKGIDFNDIPEINGVPVTEFNVDSLEDKPWKKPGVDISDYFNYGFNEETWRIYCDRQRRMRTEAHHIEQNKSHINTLSKNDNSKYSAVPPPGQNLPNPPFRAQFRRRQDGPDQQRNDNVRMPPMMMGVPGMPFPMGMPPPMMGHPNMMMAGMNRGPMMGPMGGNRMPNLQNMQLQNNAASFGGNRRQLTSIPLTSNRPDAPRE